MPSRLLFTLTLITACSSNPPPAPPKAESGTCRPAMRGNTTLDQLANKLRATDPSPTELDSLAIGIANVAHDFDRAGDAEGAEVFGRLAETTRNWSYALRSSDAARADAAVASLKADSTKARAIDKRSCP